MRRHDAHAELAASQPHSSQRTHVSSHVPQYTCQCVRQPSRDLACRACQLSHQNARAYGCRKSEYDISESPQHTLSLTEFISLGGSVPVMKTSRSSALDVRETDAWWSVRQRALNRGLARGQSVAGSIGESTFCF